MNTTYNHIIKIAKERLRLYALTHKSATRFKPYYIEKGMLYAFHPRAKLTKNGRIVAGYQPMRGVS